MRHLSAVPLVLIGLGLPLMAGYHDRDFVPPGTQIRARVDNPVIVARWDRGRIFSGHVAADVYNRDGNMVLPRGAYCEMIVRQSGPGQLMLDLESITVNGRRYVMDASGPQFNMDRDQYNNGAGVIGNIIGAIAGATGGSVQYEGDRIRVPAGSELTFQLQQPVHIVNWSDEGYDRGGYHYHHEENHGWYR